MKPSVRTAVIAVSLIALTGCTEDKTSYASYELYPVRSGDLWEMHYSPSKTSFAVWAPTAEEARVLIYDQPTGGHASQTVKMEMDKEGTWHAAVSEKLDGKYYVFNIKIDGTWLGDTPGINARAVGINGDRAAIINWDTTNPDGWSNDKRPEQKHFADILLYEMHHQDFSMCDSSGIAQKGTYQALTETGTTAPGEEPSGIDHLKQLGVTHVRLLPSFDFATVDEEDISRQAAYSWGYSPKNYNVPEGAYSTDPYNPAVRILEFKKMILALHQAGIRVIMDMSYGNVWHHSSNNFEKTVPGYFLRKPDKATENSWLTTASERPMMRKFILESVLYWAREYHIDGFCLDRMSQLDVKTVNEIRQELNRLDSTIFLCGTAEEAVAGQTEADSLATLKNLAAMPEIAVVSNRLNNGLRGLANAPRKGGFVSGVSGHEETVKAGIVGGIRHPDVDYTKVTDSTEPWALQPVQTIQYVSSHEEPGLTDRLRAVSPGIKKEQLIQQHKLALTILLTSQGIPSFEAGEEMMRTQADARKYDSSTDAANTVNWNKKEEYTDLVLYYRQLIRLRKSHPAFRMNDAEQIRCHLDFLPTEQKNVIAYQLTEHANGDSWETILVAFNSNARPVQLKIPARKYRVICQDGVINTAGKQVVYGPEVTLPPYSALILH